MPVPFLSESDDQAPFPPVDRALRYPNGLLAAGGSLRPERLLRAYRQGIFPWYSPDEPILWWSPDPRCVILPDRLHVSRRLRRTLLREPFRVTRNQAFEAVIRGCAGPRRDGQGTWITAPMIDAFVALHQRGRATSFECWLGDELAGGVYGVHLGDVFFGESMFSRYSDASKIALVHVARAPDVQLIDCQISNPHLTRLGAEAIPRRNFLELLDRHGACRG